MATPTQAVLSFAVVAGLPTLVPGMGVLAGVHCVLTMAWFALLILGTGHAAPWLQGTRRVRIIDRVTGTVVAGFGVKPALEPAR